MDFQNITYNSPVKVEFYSTICNGCLSSDRNLTDLDENTAPYWSLLGQDSLISPSHIALCWECTAMLRKMRMFQQKVQRAHNILQQSLYLGDLISLSTLTKVNLDADDTIVKSKDDTQNTITKYEHTELETCKEYQPVVLLTDIKMELKEQLNIKSEDENDSVYEPDNSDLEYEPDVMNLTKPIETNTVKGSSKTRFSQKGTLIENKNVDFDNYEKNFTDICLNKDDMGSLSLGENRRRLHSKEIWCDSCKLVFDNEMFRQMHSTFYHLRTLNKKNGLRCNGCKKRFGDLVSLRKHLIKHSEAAKCNLCGFIVDWKYKRRHIEAHKHFVIQCKHCDAIFHSRTHVKYHKDTIHAQSICDICKKQFTKKHMLKTHIRENHTPFKCEKCDKYYKSYNRLMCHKDTVHVKSKPELAFCVECNRQFTNLRRYNYHLNTTLVHNPSLRESKGKVACPECGQQFCKGYAMRRHYNLIHEGVTKFQCGVCQKYLSSKNALDRHMQGVHLKIREPKNKMCDICGRGFSNNRILIQHRRTHTGERPYKCPQCPAAFSQKHPLVTHMKTQHKVSDPYSVLPTRLS